MTFLIADSFVAFHTSATHSTVSLRPGFHSTRSSKWSMFRLFLWHDRSTKQAKVLCSYHLSRRERKSGVCRCSFVKNVFINMHRKRLCTARDLFDPVPTIDQRVAFFHKHVCIHSKILFIHSLDHFFLPRPALTWCAQSSLSERRLVAVSLDRTVFFFFSQVPTVLFDGWGACRDRERRSCEWLPDMNNTLSTYISPIVSIECGMQLSSNRDTCPEDRRLASRWMRRDGQVFHFLLLSFWRSQNAAVSTNTSAVVTRHW